MTISTSIFKTALSSVGSFFGGIQTYLIVGAVAAVVGLAGGAYGGYRWELGKYETLVANGAKAQTAAVQERANSDAAQAKVNLAAALKHQKDEDALHVQYVTINHEVPKYVHDQISCPGLTVGLARVLRAYADATDPATLQLAPGQSDDACSDVAPSEVAGWFGAYAEASRANALQLNDLEAEIRANHQAQVDASKVKVSP